MFVPKKVASSLLAMAGLALVTACAMPSLTKPAGSPATSKVEGLKVAAYNRAMTGRPPAEFGDKFGMGPKSTTEQVAAAVEMAKMPKVSGPFKPTWESLDANYKIPKWEIDGKFAIFLHFGLYSIPAHHNEWYEKHMYGADMNWHIQNFGPLDKFGYKDFIPKFTLPKFNPDQWAKLFKDGGAKWVMPTAEHHDGYSLWDSKANPFNTVNMGPHRDVIGELAKAVRAQGLKFGVTNHTIEHYDFIEVEKIPEDMKTDLSADGYQDFYWVTHSDERLKQFMAQWIAKNIELIDQYRPDVIWYDNGLNHRAFDPLKLNIAAYYYNRARKWGKQVTLNAKGTCFLAGSIQDYEGVGRAPTKLTDFPWTVEDRIGSSWGYITGMKVRNPAEIVATLIDVVSKNGIYLLNLSPMGDGSIPEDQQQALLAIGKWLEVNGDAIYGTRPWTKSGEGALKLARGQRYSANDIRFTTKKGCFLKKDSLYAILMAWPDSGEAVIASLPAGAATGKPTSVTMLGNEGKLEFTQDADGLKVKLPAAKPCDDAYCLKIEGLKLK
jgi:alpha-L-fucosidase